jgi:hypothetical protein
MVELKKGLLMNRNIHGIQLVEMGGAPRVSILKVHQALYASQGDAHFRASLASMFQARMA